MSRWLLVLVVSLSALPAWAGDYDRNVVTERTLDLGFGLAPVDVDLRPLVACSDNKTATCEANVQRAGVLAARGAARSHLRNFYLGASVEAGATLPAGGFSARPWLALAGMVGLETANDAWTPLRGFIDVAILGLWANTKLADTLGFTAEAGVRYQLHTAERPHMLLHASVRGLYNFNYVGVMAFAGVGWTFD